MHGGVDAIITEDRRARFADAVPPGIEICTADEFLMRVASNHRSVVPRVTQCQLDYFGQRTDAPQPELRQDLVWHLVKAGAPVFAQVVDGIELT